MPIYKTKDENFFKKWSPKMAYVLGFFTADGNMIKNKRSAHFIEFHITDKKLLEKIKKSLGSNHKISTRTRDKKWKLGYRLQIGSKEIFNDLLKLGLTQNKSKTILFPKIPQKYLSDFIRGYFDGDGHVSICTYQKNDRKSLSTIIISGFTSGSKKFLEVLKKVLYNNAGLKGGTLCYSGRGWRLNYSILDSKKLYYYLYPKKLNNFFLNRKKKIFEKFI
ncbi:hypothetical protein KKB71_00555 [Patescibacteria group bacterium]|nr:hypothetical protein [Patescibacteria group bacterium]